MATNTFYVASIEGEDHVGVIVSPIDTNEMLGEELDTDALIIWHYMGQHVPVGDEVRIVVFLSWVRNILTKTGAIVIIQ